MIVKEYEAFALTTYTWRVEYFISLNEKQPRIEEFASTSLLNVNGQKPEEGFGGYQDDKGLWWPPLPHKPTLDEIEEREKPSEKHSRPEILRTVKYTIKYQQNGTTKTSPTNYSVYRKAVKAYAKGDFLKLTFGFNSVQKAEPI